MWGRQFWWDGWVAETTSLLNWRTGNCTGGSNPPLTAERKPQVVEKQTLAALFVSWKLHGNCTEFFTDLQKIPIWGGSNGFLPHFYRCRMSGFSPLFTAVLTAVCSGWCIPFFWPRAILTERKCTDLHYGGKALCAWPPKPKCRWPSKASLEWPL